MLIRIKNLTLKTIVGVNAWERQEAQDVVINVEMEFDGARAGETDSLGDTIDYKKTKQKILGHAGASRCLLLESLAQGVLKIVLEDPRVIRACVEVDKPKALRFADSVSVVCSADRRTGGPAKGEGGQVAGRPGATA
jgi:D-erythro-7,8-dihydroneopterin triphosphate epimerase